MRTLPFLRNRFPIYRPTKRSRHRNNGYMQQRALIAVVDDDVSSRDSLPDLLQALGFSAMAFASAEEFLASSALADTQCLILDVSMPGMSGPQLQFELSRREIKIPIVF